MPEEMSAEQFRAMQTKPKRRQRYNPKPVTRHGIDFASTSEADRYDVLLLLERGGVIRDLEPHRSITYEGHRGPVLRYTADASYIDAETGAWVIEDVKPGKMKQLPRDFIMRARLIWDLTGVVITVAQYRGGEWHLRPAFKLTKAQRERI